jgi:type IV pilus assembly protein PilB
VIRLLDKDNLMLDLTRLGFEQLSLQRFEKAISEPWGIVLVTGPTGSGKTNTLYSAISKLNSDEVNIITAENPVEFNLFGINQVNIREAIGLTFPAALRSFLRQDPNIILVGEIRDFETADIAIKAALTGHLVLSTLHTNDAPSTIARLINMGIEPFLVSSAVRLVVAQRLIRRLCGQCKKEAKTPVQTLIDIGLLPEDAKTAKVFEPSGCEKCSNTGYKGRLGLFEVMEIDDEIKEQIMIGASTGELRQKAKEKGMLTLRMSGIEKIKAGLTSIDEVLRETSKI